ncbi:ComF family protein [Clostridium thermarum]|uniref:ComF family protein n=1 Tax=Clostridium thermarum TaxID=1716543 RepID=UPI001123CF08|nr:ComF family protein [Clostridium thermarum]
MGCRFGKRVKFYLGCVLEVIYGRANNCMLCGDFAEDMLCKSCQSKMKYSLIEGEVEKEGIRFKYYSCAYYNSLVKEMIIRLKYKSDFDCGALLTQLMERLIREKEISFDYITYVPCSEETFRKRGYNQSEFLSKKLSELTGKKVVHCLRKSKSTKDQIGLDRDARWTNLENSFAVENYKAIKDKKVLLIDDVITTGATAFYCGKALLLCGCREVNILTAAKSAI